MALNPNTKPTTPGTFNGEIRNGWSWVSAANMWLDFSGINIGNTNVVNNLANAGVTTLGLGSPIGLNIGQTATNPSIQQFIQNVNDGTFSQQLSDLPAGSLPINVNAGFGNGPEFRNLNINQLVSNLKNLGLDDAFNADFAKLTRMFNIPSDLIDLITKNSVFNEGKEKSLGLYVYYTLVPMYKS